MILIYSKHITNRLTYTLNVVFKHLLKVDYRLVSLEEFSTSSQTTKINYSPLKIENCISIYPHKLLFEKDINDHKIEIEWINKKPYFFKTSKNNRFKYDLFAAIFYMVSRYEEYHATNLDFHNRFEAEQSLAFKNDFLEIPVVNLWALEIKDSILKNNSSYEFPKTNYRYLNTFDIDIAYAYKGKSSIRLISSAIKSLVTLNIKELKNRFAYWLKINKDPYDTYDLIEKEQKKHPTENYYFFLLGDYGKYDKNLAHTSNTYKKLIQRISQKNKVGIHPSYQSNDNPKKLKTEIKRLQNIIAETITHSRQHFLKLSLPNTYEQLISSGIKHDFSMGFASKIGFRAGICSPYPFFNIAKDLEYDLMITPFQIMDGTLNHYLKLNPKEAIEKIKTIVLEVKNVNGTFVSLWHNSSLEESFEWKNWTPVYKTLVEMAKGK